MLDRLSREERLLLFRLLASFAWVDGNVAAEEKKFVRRLMGKLTMSEDEVRDIEACLLFAPSEPVDVSRVSPENRRVFIEAVRALIFIDGTIDSEEQAHFDRLREQLA